MTQCILSSRVSHWSFEIDVKEIVKISATNTIEDQNTVLSIEFRPNATTWVFEICKSYSMVTADTQFLTKEPELLLPSPRMDKEGQGKEKKVERKTHLADPVLLSSTTRKGFLLCGRLSICECERHLVRRRTKPILSTISEVTMRKVHCND